MREPRSLAGPLMRTPGTVYAWTTQGVPLTLWTSGRVWDWDGGSAR